LSDGSEAAKKNRPVSKTERDGNGLPHDAMKPKPKEWTEIEKQALIRLVREGATVREITARLRRHAGSVRRMAKEMNLVLKK
jgi:transposase